MIVLAKSSIPQADIAIIGGSGTFAMNFPEDLSLGDIEVLEDNIIIKTPYGEGPSLKCFAVGGRRVLTVKMHGWRAGVTRADASRQVFWIFREAGIRSIIAEGGVGSINHLLKPGDMIIPSDYIDFSMRRDVSLEGQYLLVMRQPVCPGITRTLIECAEKKYSGRVFDRGIYAVTDGRHFESRSEVAMFARLGADVVGQSMCPEVYLARETGSCYGRVDLVVNYAEGVVKDWEYGQLRDMFYNMPHRVAGVLTDAVRNLDMGSGCGCGSLRHETLMKRGWQ